MRSRRHGQNLDEPEAPTAHSASKHKPLAWVSVGALCAVLVVVFEVDEDLWFGSSDDAAAEHIAAESMAAMVGRILGAKPFPVAAKRLEELTRNPSTRIDQIVRVLEGDPALSARLLRLVNSAGYALRLRCTSVRHAAALVGMRRLHQVATTAAVLDMFDANSDAAVEILEHAAVVGSFCRYLGVHLGLPRDELFTCGFLHDIGKLMLLDTEAASYAPLLEQYRDEPDAIHAVEREKYGFDHAVLAAHVLSAWNIPDPVPKVVAWHHQVARAYQAGTTISAMVQALRLADALSYVVGRVSNYDAVVQIANGEAATYLEISEPQLAAMWDDLVALRQQSRVGARGSDVSELVIVPRREALPNKRAPKSRVAEAPKHFPCVACKKPSFGNVCPCCKGHVCPEHQTRTGEWCVLCVREYERSRKASKIDANGILKMAAVLAVLAAVAGSRAASVPAAEWYNVALAPLFVVGLASLLMAVARRWRLRSSFVRARQRKPRPSDALPIAEQAGASAAQGMDSDGPEAEPEILVIDNSLPPPGSSLRPFSVPGQRIAAKLSVVPDLKNSFPAGAPSLVPKDAVVIGFAQPSLRCIAAMPSNVPPASRTGFEGVRCSLPPYAPRVSIRPAEPTPSLSNRTPSPVSEAALEVPEPFPSVRVPATAPLPTIVINDLDSYQVPPGNLDAPAISVRFTSIPVASDSAWPKDESPVWPAHGRVTTWENTTHRP